MRRACVLAFLLFLSLETPIQAVGAVHHKTYQKHVSGLVGTMVDGISELKHGIRSGKVKNTPEVVASSFGKTITKILKQASSLETHHQAVASLEDREFEEQPINDEVQAKLAAMAEATTAKMAKGEEPDEIPDDENKWKNMFIFLALVAFAIYLAGAMAFHVTNMKNPDNKVTVAEFLGSTPQAFADPMAIAVGMVSGFVFGFIDNAGLFFGMKYMEPFFSLFPLSEEELVGAGYGNTFSDMIGAFLGTFMGKAIQELSQINNYPIWTEAIGITVGCIFGVMIPRMMTNPAKEALASAAAEAKRSGITEAELLEYRKVFKQLDEEVDHEKSGAIHLASLDEIGMTSLVPILREADNGDGWINETEFLRGLAKARRRQNKSQPKV